MDAVNPSLPFQVAWSPPANLSRSGAASQPSMVVDAGGTIQAFWMDSFDGLVTAVYNGSVWSLPVVVSLQNEPVTRKPEVVPAPPVLFVDGQNRIHAFQHGQPGLLTGIPPLIENQMLLGTTTWSPAVQIAESALVFHLTRLANGEISLAYIRDYKSTLFEPGVFVRKTFGGATWQTAVAVHNSIYYRNLKNPPATIKSAASGNLLSLVWTEPRFGLYYSSDSFDFGNTWTHPQALEFPGAIPTNPIVLPLPLGGMLRIWQDSSQSSCTLYQQQLEALPADAVTQPAPAPAAPPPASEWSQPVRILNGLQTCPSDSDFILDGNELYWYWGAGTESINITAWDSNNSQWYEPHTISVTFDDAESRRFVQLDELALMINAGKITVIGSDKAGGEVWATSADRSALEFVTAPPSPWMQPLLVSQSGQQVREPAVALDDQGVEHLVWSQELASSGSSLFYSRFDNQQATQPVEIFKGGNGDISRQPSLLSDSQGNLHLSWIGGKSGLLTYSRAMVDNAGSAFGWLPVKNLDEKSDISRPQLVLAPGGRLYVVYAIPRNEQRGVYLVYSDDSGDTWSAPVVVFDAVKAGWEGVDHPTLAIGSDGGVHVAFARMVSTGALPTEGVFYTRSSPDPTTGSLELAVWSDLFQVAESGNDWPRLAIVAGQLHLLYANKSDIGHRWVLENQLLPDGAGWGDAHRVPGWQDMTLSGEPPYAIASDRLNLYLVGAAPGEAGLNYSVWSVDAQDPATGRWNQLEAFTPGGQWQNSASFATAATQPSGEALVVAWLAQAIAGQLSTPVPREPGILFSIRSLEVLQVPDMPLAPTQRSIVQPSPSPQPSASATPILLPTSNLTGPQLPISPQALGGGLAAIIVVIIFVGILMRGRSHPRGGI